MHIFNNNFVLGILNQVFDFFYEYPQMTLFGWLVSQPASNAFFHTKSTPTNSTFLSQQIRASHQA